MRTIVATIAAAAALALGAGHAAAAAPPFTASTTTPVVGQTVTFVADPCPVRCAYKWTVTTTNPVSHKTTTYLTDAHQSISWTFSDDTVYTILLRETAGNGTNSVVATGQLSMKAVPAP